VGSIKDPQGAELRALEQVADFSGRRVLEVGCGDGRMTWLYADRAAGVLGIDNEEELIAAAQAATPPALADRVRFRVGDAQELGEPPQTFDVAFLSWSL